MLQDYGTTKTYTTITQTEPTSVTYYVRVKDSNDEVSTECKSVTVTWQNVKPTANNVNGSANE